MHCGLKLHCLWALSRATVKTLLPRSNAVITRHWGLSHPLQIKPRTGNTQVIRGLLFCISVQCQSLAVGAKNGKGEKKTDFLCDGYWMLENKSTARAASQYSAECDRCVATYRRNEFTHGFNICMLARWNCTRRGFCARALSLGFHNP